MSDLLQQLKELDTFQKNAVVRIQTLGGFNLWRNQDKIDSKDWGRD
jgi:hypothetical protein